MTKIDEDLLEIVSNICERDQLGKINSCVRQNIGFNRAVFNVNDQYCIKLCININKESGIINEIRYYSENQNYFNPQLIAYDITKEFIPYIYTVEEKAQGINLFDIWKNLNQTDREQCLLELINIMKLIHQPIGIKEEPKLKILSKYDDFLDSLTKANLLSSDKIRYLNILRMYLPIYFENADYGLVHGDIHFNNILYSENGLKLIDFECYEQAPLDKEFDSIRRMVRNPNSLIKKGVQDFVNPDDYKDIMPFLVHHYPEVCKKEGFDNRLLIYDCINSLKWMLVYPEHKPYHDILFEKSKVLIK